MIEANLRGGVQKVVAYSLSSLETPPGAVGHICLPRGWGKHLLAAPVRLVGGRVNDAECGALEFGRLPGRVHRAGVILVIQVDEY